MSLSHALGSAIEVPTEMEHARDTGAEHADFSYWSMLMGGSFWGEGSARSRHASRRSRRVLLLCLGAVFAVTFSPGIERELAHAVQSALVGLTLTYLAWEAWRYTTGLDELARRVYLEAFAITYLIGLAMFSILGVLQDVAGWRITPLAFMVLEPVRGVVLAWRSRRFA